MDDEDSKIRRNLIALASVILLLAWLKVPLDLVGERLLGVASKGGFTISAKRVWSAALILLVYFSLRYRFSNEHQEGMKTLIAEYPDIERRTLKRWLVCELAIFTRWGWHMPLLGELSSKIDAGLQRRSSAQVAVPLVRMSLTDASLGRLIRGRFEPSRRLGTASLQYFVRIDGGDAPMPQVAVDIELSRVGRAFLSGFAGLRLCFYSKASTLLMTPWVLTAGAIGLTLRRLWQVW
ncbi:hypothetical protein D3C87_1049680 [compost metagenome]